MKNHQVHNLIILDESGSMSSIRDVIVKGFNELVQTIHGIEKQFPEQQHFVSLVTFNSLGQKLLHFLDPARKLQQINDQSYNPESMTPLYDAMGSSINKLKLCLQGQTDYNVRVTILTDGEENDSKEFSRNDVKKLVEELQGNRWTFNYIGTDHDVEKVAKSLSIERSISFDKNDFAIEAMFHEEREVLIQFSKAISFRNKDL